MKYFLYDEVCIHNKRHDFWVVIHGNVLDLTPLLKDRYDSWNIILDYLLAFGGKDLSHFFHLNNLPKTETSPLTGKPRVLFPPILETATSDHAKTPGLKLWSQDPFYHIGCVTRRPHKIRLINTLTATTAYMTVCDEDTIFDIQRKYKEFYNNHAGSYVWRKFTTASEHSGQCPGNLILNKTLKGNGLIEEANGSDTELHSPSIWLYYTDDLTVA